MSKKYLLSDAPTVSHAIRMQDDGSFIMYQETHFALNADEVSMLKTVLKSAQNDMRNRQSCVTENYSIEYAPWHSDFDKIAITHKRNGRMVSMSLSTAWKLLDSIG